MKLDKKVFEEKKLNNLSFVINWGNTWQYFAIHVDTWGRPSAQGFQLPVIRAKVLAPSDGYFFNKSEVDMPIWRDDKVFNWRHDIQHNDIQHSDTQHNGLIRDAQHALYEAKALSIIRLSVTFSYCYAECRYAVCHYAECRYAECRYAECRYAECRYAECRHAQCRHYNTCNDFTFNGFTCNDHTSSQANQLAKFYFIFTVIRKVIYK